MQSPRSAYPAVLDAQLAQNEATLAAQRAALQVARLNLSYTTTSATTLSVNSIPRTHPYTLAATRRGLQSQVQARSRPAPAGLPRPGLFGAVHANISALSSRRLKERFAVDYAVRMFMGVCEEITAYGAWGINE